MPKYAIYSVTDIDSLHQPDKEKEIEQLDLTGKKFSMLKVLGPAEEQNPKHSKVWKCQCMCGKVVEVSTAKLLRGAQTSCGCTSFKMSWHRLEGYGRLIGLERAIKKSDENRNSHSSLVSQRLYGLPGIKRMNGNLYLGQVIFLGKRFRLGMTSNIELLRGGYEASDKMLFKQIPLIVRMCKRIWEFDPEIGREYLNNIDIAVTLNDEKSEFEFYPSAKSIVKMVKIAEAVDKLDLSEDEKKDKFRKEVHEKIPVKEKGSGAWLSEYSEGVHYAKSKRIKIN